MTDNTGKPIPEEFQLLRQEFHAFWEAGLRGMAYIDKTAIVCHLDLDQEKVTLTRVFYKSPNIMHKERAEDVMIDWFTEEQLIQVADSVDIDLYMNYSPLRLTVDGLISVLNTLKAMGKEIKVSLKFVELYKVALAEEDFEENREGLRMLRDYGVRLDVMKGRDWLFLLQTLTKKSAKKRQNGCNNAARSRLRQLLLDPQNETTSVDPSMLQSSPERSEDSPMASCSEDSRVASCSEDSRLTSFSDDDDVNKDT